MGTLREEVHQLLEDDAKLHTGTELGSLLGKYATEPYGVMFLAPPVNPAPPYIIFYINAESGRFPRDITINVTAYGNNFEAVLKRVYDLLHKTQITATDYSVKMMVYDWSSPDMFDDDLKCYKKSQRYWVKGIKV